MSAALSAGLPETAGLTGQVSLVVLAGGVAGAGIALLAYALIARPAPRSGVDQRSIGYRAARGWIDTQRRLPIGLLVALLTLVVTRWPVAALAAFGLSLGWPVLMGGSGSERRSAQRLEALAIWTESLRDTTAGSVGLEQAIISTARTAPAPIAPELVSLADRLRMRMPLTQALHRMADDLDDASADLVVAALLLNSRLRGPGLRQVLTSLSESARAELEMRGRVTAGRAATRRSVQIVVIVTLTFVFGLVVLNPSYVEPYRHPAGQLVLTLVVGFFAAGFLWLRRLSAYDVPERFLHVGNTGYRSDFGTDYDRGHDRRGAGNREPTGIR
jgi:Flp pilus assembly protein TadB